ncbi:MAG TPA: TonB family protein [Sandaracinaceae bacterium LLY-WYZ-13_1]|nr:TonB family protein [Sandaracinaceae bacterium LLY-WYZ-13_1]
MHVGRWLAAAGFSGGVNVVVAFGLASLSGAGEPEGDALRTSVRAVPPPPPPPESEPEPETEEPVEVMQEQAVLPPLDLPEPTAGSDAIAVPRTDPSLLEFQGAFAMPAFVAGRGAKAEMAEAMERQDAQLVYQPDPERFYPRQARAQGLEGRSLVRVRIDARGKVVSAECVQSEPHGIFDEAAEALARNMRYRPAMRNGRPEPATRTVEVKWNLPE